MLIGSHVSISKGLLGAAEEAYSYGANTFMVYTGAPQNTVRKPLSDLKIDEGKAFMAEKGISDIVVHAPYIINMASYIKMSETSFGRIALIMVKAIIPSLLYYCICYLT